MLTSLKEYAQKIELDAPAKRIKEKNSEELCGVFSKYARHDLSIDEIMKLEKETYREARAEAAVERYLRSYDIA